jgi:sulfite exporter TauE/SafE
MLSLWLRDYLPLDLLSTWGERLVGVMLFGIGLWAIRKVFTIHAHEHHHENGSHLHLHAHRKIVPHEKHESHQHHTHAAFGIGVLHGLAGSSHFFGVLAALAFPTRAQAIAYLFAFGVGTIASMAVFSTLIGWLASRCSVAGLSAYRGLMSLCALGAIAVGIFWMVH